MDLQLDPHTLLQLEKEGFQVTTKQLRTGNIFYQNEQELEQYKPSSLATPLRTGCFKQCPKNGEKNLTIKSVLTQPKPSQNKRNSKMESKQSETTSIQTREREQRYNTRSQMMDETSSVRTQSQIKNGYYKSEISDRKVVILTNNKKERGKIISKRAFDKLSYTTKDSEYGFESMHSNLRNLKFNVNKYQGKNKTQRIGEETRAESSLYYNNNISSLTSANRNHSKQTPAALCKIKLGFFDNLLLNINPEKKHNDDEEFQKPDPILRPILKKKQSPCSNLPAESAETLEMNEISNKAQTFIDEMNAVNLKNLQNRDHHQVYNNNYNKLVTLQIETIQLQNQRSKIIKKFKVYQEDQLKWPIESILIKDCHLIRPKNGENKRISQEQDYDSDKDIVNSAKQKLKREVKDAILEQIGEKTESM